MCTNIFNKSWKEISFNFLVYFPVILLLIFILLIFFTYLFTYLLVMINTPPSEQDNQFLFGNTLSTSRASEKGRILLGVELFLMIMLLTSFFSTVFMDPGYFPSPTEIESKLMLINSQFGKDEPSSEKSNSSKLEKSDSILDYKNIFKYDPDENYSKNMPKHEKMRLLTKFDKDFSKGPLNMQEIIDIRKNISRLFSERFDKLENKYSCYLNEEIVMNNKKEFMGQYSHELEKSSCLKTNPHLPSSEIIAINMYKGSDLQRLTLCGTCMRFKVERSHHCRQCGRCVLKMDHHCPWLANCIGFKNYKAFCLLHFYGTLATLIITLSFWEVIVNYNLSYDIPLAKLIFVLFVYITNIGLMAFLMWLLIVNCGLVLNGMTIIEQAERERFTSIEKNSYDVGSYRNFTNIFGTNPFLWFIPFVFNNKGKGLAFETDYFRMD